MGKSLADQLLKAGLVDKKQVNKAMQAKKHNKPKAQGKKKSADHPDPEQLKRQQVQARKAERDRRLNQARETEAKRKALVAQVRQLIESNRLPRTDETDGDIPYHFEDNQKIKRLFVSKDIHRQIADGKLGIVKLGKGYELVAKTVVEKIRERGDQTSVVLLNTTAQVTESGTRTVNTPEDPYADYPVPDDLMW